MSRNYFQTEEFKDLLKSYEHQRKRGTYTYFDADDFADIADYYLTVDKPSLAMGAINEGLSMHPDEEMLLSMQSSVYIYQHAYGKALKVLNRLDAENPEVVYQLAQLEYAQKGNTKKAEKMWRKWLEMDENRDSSSEVKRENYIHIISSMAELHGYSAQRPTCDLDALRRWIREYIDLFQPLGKYDEDQQLVDICRENELPDLMSEALAQVLEERPYLPQGWANLALAQYLSEQYEQALESCAFALAINPDDTDALLTQAHTYLTMGEHSAAQSVFREYLDKGGDELQTIPYAETLLQGGEEEEAFERLDRLARHVEKQMWDAYDHYESLKRSGVVGKKTKLAQQVYDDHADLFKRTLTDIGDMYHHSGYFQKSLEAYLHITRIFGKNAEAYFMQGVNHLAMSQFAEASEDLAMAMQWSDDRVMMGIDIALTFLLNNFDQFAIDVLDTLCKYTENRQSPFYKNIPAAKSIAYLKLGYTDQFLKFFRIACDDTPELVGKVYDGYFPKDIPFDQWYDYADKHTDTLVKRFKQNDMHFKNLI